MDDINKPRSGRRVPLSTQRRGFAQLPNRLGIKTGMFHLHSQLAGNTSENDKGTAAPKPPLSVQQKVRRNVVLRIQFPKWRLPHINIPYVEKIADHYPFLRDLRVRVSMWTVAAIVVIAEIITMVQPFFMQHNAYALGAAGSLLSPVNQIMADKLKLNTKQQVYNFNQKYSSMPRGMLGATGPQIQATANVDPTKGVTVTDSQNNIDFTVKPKFNLMAGKQDGNRVVYPLAGNNGWAVYTMHAVGVKEDLLLTRATGNTMAFDYTLGLGSNLAARVQKDGSIGVFGNTLFSGNVATSDSKDAALLQKARQNAQKNTLLFSIPAPTVRSFGRIKTSVHAKYSVHGDDLTVTVTNLNKARYPITVDPSIFVTSATQFMEGNNETNVDFNADDGLIEKGFTTGARFDSWQATTNMNQSTWQQGLAVTGGYIYDIGGINSNGGTVDYTSAGTSNFVVPTGITSVTIKAWGAGGGGGGGGRSSGDNGGAGGGGGFTQATVAVSASQTLNVTVGSAGGAGNGSSRSGRGGGGGGYSSVYLSGSPLAIAAGGAGGGGGSEAGGVGGAGGAGGGTSGVAGSADSSGNSHGGGQGTSGAGGGGGTGGSNSGSGGSSLTGGAGGDGRSSNGTDGSANNGGSFGSGGDGGSNDANNYYAGGGGGSGGYFGGGGGSGSQNTAAAGGGGGGSSFTCTSGCSSQTNTQGSGQTPGNSSDPDIGSAAAGGGGGLTRASGTAGAAGLVIITYSSSPTTLTSISWSKLNPDTGLIEDANPGTGNCSGWCTNSLYDLPAARSSFSLVAYNDFLYAIGGEDSSCTSGAGTGDSGVCKTVYIAKLGANGEPQLWNPSGGGATFWYRDTDLSSPRSFTDAVAYNGYMYLLGGKTSTSGTPSIVGTAQVAPITGTGQIGSWTTTTALPYNDYGYGAQVYNGYIYLVGGASSIGGAPLSTVYYSKINSSDGALNSWVQTTSLSGGRFDEGGNFTTVWGGYLYLAGGCSAVVGGGKDYCSTIQDDTQLASINADGSLDVWNGIDTSIVSDQRTGQSLAAWRGALYQFGGCTAQDGTSGNCTTTLNTTDCSGNQNGDCAVDQDGDASTVSVSFDPGDSDPDNTCVGGSPYNCNLPPAGSGSGQIGEMLNATAIMNGYLYVIGGCANVGCSSTSDNTAYVSISSTGTLTAPANCTTDGNTLVGAWCVDSTHTIGSGVAAAGTAIFGGRIYVAGGLNGSNNVNQIYYTNFNSDGSLPANWTTQTMAGADNVSYDYAYARANPSSAGTNPGNLFIIGGCNSSSSAGCNTGGSPYDNAVFKCNILTTGAVSGCSTTANGTQLQIDDVTTNGGSTDCGSGLGAMAGTVYANYIYLIGGLTPSCTDLTTTMYAKIDSNNNVVAVSGTTWIQSPMLTHHGRRRGAAFGYNGYIYVVGGYDGSGGGILGDIEFAKIDVSDGSLTDQSGGSNLFNQSEVAIGQRWGLSVPVSNSYAYVIGGCNHGNAPTCTTSGSLGLDPQIQTFQIYNNDSGSPSGYSTSSHTYGTDANRVGVASAVLNGYIYAAGGCTAADCSSVSSNVSYATLDANGTVGSWSNTTASLTAGRAWGKLLAAGGTLYYLGGQDSSSVSQSTVYYGTPSSGNVTTWGTATDGLPAARTDFGAAVWNNRLYVVGGASGTVGSVTYTTGGTNTFVVPSNVNSITIKAWGAGGAGGGGSGSTGTGGAGGAGGFAQATISVTPGWSLNVSVGSGGTKVSTNSNGGNGGGYSAVQHTGTYLIQAGSGGGGGGTLGTTSGGAGGAGGGSTGVAASNGSGTGPGGGGGGGTTSAGGTAGAAGTATPNAAGAAGAANAGGDGAGSSAACNTAMAGKTGGAGGTGAGGKGGNVASCEGGGGGGGGRFGGGGGGDNSNTANRAAGGGGGGSDLVTGGGTIEQAGSGTTPGQTFDPSWNGTAGTGGSGATTAAGTTAGKDGEVVITYGTYNSTVYVSPQLNAGGNITSTWDSSSTSFNVARSGLTAIAYANNLYVLGGFDGINYLSDVQFSQLNTSNGEAGSWTYSTNLPNTLREASGFAVNGYMYLIGGRSEDTSCTPVTLVAPISANTSISSGNDPTGVGDWYQTSAAYSGNRYGNGAVYSSGKAYVLGGACSGTFASPVTQQTAVLSQPQVAQYSIMFDTSSDVYPNMWLLNGIDNSVGARWQLSYQSMKNTSSLCLGSSMTTWGQKTNFGDVTLDTPGVYTALDGSGTNTTCARFYDFFINIDSSQAYGYPEDISRGPTITDLTFEYEADPSKRLMHGRTFTGGLQQPDDTPCSQAAYAACPVP